MERQMITNAHIITQHIHLMAHVEAITEKCRLRPPIEVSVVDNERNQFEVDYGPETDELDFPAILLVLPIRLRLTDTRDKQVEVQLADLVPLAEWSKRFQQ
jgi:hypothetical protein